MTGRVKYCEVCKIDFSILFRVQYQTSKEWIFVCHECLLNLKKDNPAYKYGGTWKKWVL